jgi:hypothetical protein
MSCDRTLGEAKAEGEPAMLLRAFGINPPLKTDAAGDGLRPYVISAAAPLSAAQGSSSSGSRWRAKQ